jgi:hypothetical protein
MPLRQNRLLRLPLGLPRQRRIWHRKTRRGPQFFAAQAFPGQAIYHLAQARHGGLAPAAGGYKFNSWNGHNWHIILFLKEWRGAPWYAFLSAEWAGTRAWIIKHQEAQHEASLQFGFI